MDDKKNESMLILIVPEVIKLIIENYNMDEIEATDKFYKSKLYEQLECEETKLWHLSPLTLFNMFEDETKLGFINYPEEA